MKGLLTKMYNLVLVAVLLRINNERQRVSAKWKIDYVRNPPTSFGVITNMATAANSTGEKND